MMIHGVFERFPKLRVAFLESGCGWVPYLMDRLEESYEHRYNRWPHKATDRRSEIMRGGNLFYSCEVGESHARQRGRVDGQLATDLAVGFSP